MSSFWDTPRSEGCQKVFKNGQKAQVPLQVHKVDFAAFEKSCFLQKKHEITKNHSFVKSIKIQKYKINLIYSDSIKNKSC